MLNLLADIASKKEIKNSVKSWKGFDSRQLPPKQRKIASHAFTNFAKIIHYGKSKTYRFTSFYDIYLKLLENILIVLGNL